MDISKKNKRGLTLATRNNSTTSKSANVTIGFGELLGWDNIYNTIYFELSYQTGQVNGRVGVYNNKRSEIKTVDDTIYFQKWKPYKQSNLWSLGTNAKTLTLGVQSSPVRRKAEWHDAPALIVINYYGKDGYDKLPLLFLNELQDIKNFPTNEYAWRVRAAEVLEEKGLRLLPTTLTEFGAMFHEFFIDLIPHFSKQNTVFLNDKRPFDAQNDKLNGAWAYPSHFVEKNGGYVPVGDSTWDDIHFLKTKFSELHYLSLRSVQHGDQ